jgi:hypothetical protein
VTCQSGGIDGEMGQTAASDWWDGGHGGVSRHPDLDLVLPRDHQVALIRQSALHSSLHCRLCHWSRSVT